MRSALSMLLTSQADALNVVDAAGTTIGHVTFDDVRGAFVRDGQESLSRTSLNGTAAR